MLVGGEGGGRVFGPAGRILAAAVLSPLVPQRWIGLTATDDGDDLRSLTEHLTAGRVTPVVGKTVAFERAAEAVAYVGLGHGRGKTVVRVAPA